MDITLTGFHKYKFETCLSDFKEELLLKHVTYYERLLVFRHLNPFSQKTILKFDITDLELSFNKEDLVSVRFYIQTESTPHILNSLVEMLDNNYSTNVIPSNFNLYSKIEHYWLYENFLTGIGNNEKGKYIYITNREFNQDFINKE